MTYYDILPSWSPSLEENLERARKLGYSVLLITNSSDLSPNARVYLLEYSTNWRERARRMRNRFQWIVGLPRRINEARDMCNSNLIDILLVDPRSKPYFDYVCAKFLKMRKGAVMVPISWMFPKVNLVRSVNWTSLQVKIAFKASIPVIASSLAENPWEIPTPRQMRAILESTLRVNPGQALHMVSTFPDYFFSRERALAKRGVIRGEI